ncbi:MAG: hypothetical protein ACFBSC_08930 [Microcoleaceae cyanobacterium]
MRRFGLIVATGVLAIWLGACGSQQTTEEDTTATAPEESVTDQSEATDGESPDTESEETPAPFEEPLVEQKANTAAEAGLIQSTKPQERLLQLRGGNGAVATAPATTTPGAGDQPIEDPFAVPKPEFVESASDPDSATTELDLTARAVPVLPELPVGSVPRAWGETTIATGAVPQTSPFGGPIPGDSANGTTPTVTAANGGTPRPTPVAANGRNGGTQNGSTSPSARPTNPATPGTQTPSPNNGGGQTTPKPASIPELPSLPVANVPSLPELPSQTPPTAWIDPNRPPVVAEQEAAPPPPPRTDLAEGIEVTGVVQAKAGTQVILKAPAEPTSRYVSVGSRVANGQVLVKRVKFSEGSDPIVIFEQNGVEIAVAVGEVQAPPENLNELVPPPPIVNALQTAS